MVIFHSYVKLPEGTSYTIQIDPVEHGPMMYNDSWWTDVNSHSDIPFISVFLHFLGKMVILTPPMSDKKTHCQLPWLPQLSCSSSVAATWLPRHHSRSPWSWLERWGCWGKGIEDELRIDGLSFGSSAPFGTLAWAGSGIRSSQICRCWLWNKSLLFFSGENASSVTLCTFMSTF